jgi:hypothetical protein
MIDRVSRAMKEVQEDLDQIVKLLQIRVTELETQLETLRLRLAGIERSVTSVVPMDPAAFRPALKEAFDRLNEGERGFGIVAIADLRRALGARLTRAAFDEQLVRLHDAGVVQLMAAPGTVRDERQKDALVHPTQGRFYYLRWERQT